MPSHPEAPLCLSKLISNVTDQFFEAFTNILGSSPITSVQFSSVAQSCPTLCDPMDCSSHLHRIVRSPLRLGRAEPEEAPWGELTGGGRPGAAEWREAPSRPSGPVPAPPDPPATLGIHGRLKDPDGPRCPRPIPNPSLRNPSPPGPPRPLQTPLAPETLLGVAGHLLPYTFQSPRPKPFRTLPPQTARPPEALPPLQGPGTPEDPQFQTSPDSFRTPATVPDFPFPRPLQDRKSVV